MVVFEILSSHLHMARWHEAKIDQHTQDLEALQEATAKIKERLLALDQVGDCSHFGKAPLFTCKSLMCKHLLVSGPWKELLTPGCGSACTIWHA